MIEYIFMIKMGKQNVKLKFKSYSWVNTPLKSNSEDAIHKYLMIIVIFDIILMNFKCIFL